MIRCWHPDIEQLEKRVGGVGVELVGAIDDDHAPSARGRRQAQEDPACAPDEGQDLRAKTGHDESEKEVRRLDRKPSPVIEQGIGPIRPDQ